jgi:lipoprotein-anchoring transpeptidase ErfK/SrfK
MQRILALAFAAGFSACATASAAPLVLHPEYPAQAESAPLRQVAAPSPQSYAAPAPNLGGGFIELLFGGPMRPRMPGNYAPPAQPDMAAIDPQTSPGYAPGYEMDPRYEKQVVEYHGDETPGTVIVNTRERLLYLVQDGGKALRYGIGVGRPGFTWAGVHHVTNKREWPDWTPPDEMLKRRPDLPRHMAGGPDNPLGARAMYLGSTLYRIHGSNEPWTIGTQVSSGCIRMRNEDVIDLYERVKVGTKVVVI